MTSQATLNRALSYIETHLTSEIDYDVVAQQALTSKYQLNRVFSFLTGMTLAEYVRQRRMTRAVNDLQQGLKIIDVAVKYDYQSGDAFSRAFQQFHGVSPSAVRHKQIALNSLSPMTFQLTIQGGERMQYRIVEKERFNIIGLTKRVPLVATGINPDIVAMTQQLTPEIIGELKALSDVEPIGMISASTNFDEDRSSGAGYLDHYIGVLSSQQTDKYASLAVPKGTWAVFTVRGPFPQTLQNTWGRIYSEWLPETQFELVPGPELVWHASPDTTLPEYHSEIWLPVKEKK